MLGARALYTSTAHAGERRASVRMQTSLTEDHRVLPKHSLPGQCVGKRKGLAALARSAQDDRLVWEDDDLPVTKAKLTSVSSPSHEGAQRRD
jgi:hypothetical protein